VQGFNVVGFLPVPVQYTLTQNTDTYVPLQILEENRFQETYVAFCTGVYFCYCYQRGFLMYLLTDSKRLNPQDFNVSKHEATCQDVPIHTNSVLHTSYIQCIQYMDEKWEWESVWLMGNCLFTQLMEATQETVSISSAGNICGRNKVRSIEYK
jgi:hypothetical protein